MLVANRTPLEELNMENQTALTTLEVERTSLKSLLPSQMPNIETLSIIHSTITKMDL